MWTYYPALLKRAVPRYTSYPTAADFTPAVGEREMTQALDAVGQDEDISLYLHIPYCHEICWYCGCNTGAAGRRQRLSAYVEALESEIALVAKHLGGRGKVKRIAWGGGSPNALSPIDFVRLLQQVTVCFGAAAPEIAMEIDPRSLDQRWADTLGAAGVRRVSMGVQTFAPAIQAQIGRIQPFNLIASTTAMLRRAGVSTINFDLMYGLPGQSLEDVSETLALSASLEPDRIALFGYAHVPHLLPRQRRIDGRALPGRAARFAMARFGHAYLTALGYVPVGFDHFARPGDALANAAIAGTLRRNFQGFTDDPSQVLIGLGASAISQFPGLIVQNEKNVGQYRAILAEGRLPAARGVAVSAEDMACAQKIFDLLCKGEAQIDPHFLSPEVLAALRPFEARGLVVRQGERLVMPADALPYRRSVAAILDPHLSQTEARFSTAI